mmetsp:Transcript_11877/g.24627  ORF Transcript_11877/g.24627 Transcript_11877/m.24627 type:complete len:216 (-) Transcript_11877:549-1196(-)
MQLVGSQHLHEVLSERCLGGLHELCVEACAAASELRHLLSALLLGLRLHHVNGRGGPREHEAAREQPIANLARAALLCRGLLAHDLDLVLAEPHHREHLLRLLPLGLHCCLHELASQLGQLYAVLEREALGGAQCRKLAAGDARGCSGISALLALLVPEPFQAAHGGHEDGGLTDVELAELLLGTNLRDLKEVDSKHFSGLLDHRPCFVVLFRPT